MGYEAVIIFMCRENKNIATYQVESDSLDYVVGRVRNSLISNTDAVLKPVRASIFDKQANSFVFNNLVGWEEGNHNLLLNLLSDFVEQQIPDARQK